MDAVADKLLLVLQYHKGDAAEAFELAELILALREMEPGPAKFDFMFYYAPGAKQPPASLLGELVSSGVKCSCRCSEVEVEGWPQAPNSTWKKLMRQLVTTPEIHADCRHVFTAEPDSAPLVINWAAQLMEEHLIGVSSGMIFSGHHTKTAAGTHPHVNGNLIFDRIALRVHLHEFQRKVEMAWDVEHADFIIPRAYDNRKLWSVWRGEVLRSSFAPGLSKGEGPCAWLHGCRGNHLKDEVRRRWLSHGAAQPVRKVITIVRTRDKEQDPEAEDYVTSVKSWANNGGFLIKAPLHIRADLLNNLEKELADLNFPEFLCSRHPENQPDAFKFCELADTTVLYAAPGNKLMQDLAESCVTERDVSERLAKARGVTWAQQGLWEPVDLPEIRQPRWVVLAHLPAIGWQTVSQGDDRVQATADASRTLSRGRVIILDTKLYTARELRRKPKEETPK